MQGKNNMHNMCITIRVVGYEYGHNYTHNKMDNHENSNGHYMHNMIIIMRIIIGIVVRIISGNIIGQRSLTIIKCRNAHVITRLIMGSTLSIIFCIDYANNTHNMIMRMGTIIRITICIIIIHNNTHNLLIICLIICIIDCVLICKTEKNYLTSIIYAQQYA